MTTYFEFHRAEPHIAAWSPNIDVYERPDEMIVLVEMPGVERSDVQLSWNDGVLTIAGRKRQQLPDRSHATYLCVERTYGQFRRDIEINIPIDHKNAKAELRDGLMKIHLPKRTSQPEASVIPIL